MEIIKIWHVQLFIWLTSKKLKKKKRNNFFFCFFVSLRDISSTSFAMLLFGGIIATQFSSSFAPTPRYRWSQISFIGQIFININVLTITSATTNFYFFHFAHTVPCRVHLTISILIYLNQKMLIIVHSVDGWLTVSKNIVDTQTKNEKQRSENTACDSDVKINTKRRNRITVLWSTKNLLMIFTFIHISFFFFAFFASYSCTSMCSVCCALCAVCCVKQFSGVDTQPHDFYSKWYKGVCVTKLLSQTKFVQIIIRNLMAEQRSTDTYIMCECFVRLFPIFLHLLRELDTVS